MLRRLRPSAAIRAYATQAPPPVKPYQTGPLPPKGYKPPPTPESTTSEPTPPTPIPSFLEREPLDPARGAAASLRVAREGVLDPRYKPAARRVVAIICALPVFIVMSWVLYQREFMGVEQKKHKPRGEQSEEPAVEVVDAAK